MPGWLIVQGAFLAVMVLLVVTLAHGTRRRGRTTSHLDPEEPGITFGWQEGAMRDPRPRRDPDSGGRSGPD